MGYVVGTDIFQTFQLPFFLFSLGKESCLMPLASSTLLNQKMQAVRLVFSWGLCMAFSVAQTKNEDSPGTWKAVEAVRNPNSWYSWAGHRHSSPPPSAVTSSWKKPENETGRLGERKSTDWWWQKLKSLFSGSDNLTIYMIELDLHLAQQFIKPSLLMSQTSLSEVMLPWPLPLIIYSTVQLLLLFFKMEL